MKTDREGGDYSGPPGEEGRESSDSLLASSPSVTVAVGPWERAVLQVGWSLKWMEVSYEEAPSG